ncbi:TB2/DP1, HVA22 family-domain-containing protein [Auriculariales sp. MPI-PUGE-AT-0066]|nr:TB2/DP1, HVA22 family-domain-containing protein [Auriculariales sp. MPI-PUGE-AT-0066]
MFYYALRLLTAYFVFIFPAYASYKSLSHRPVLDADLERWVKHWTVLALVVAFEILFEWVIEWIPFYWELKTFVLLFLALPQTQGAVYIYDQQLLPFLSRNEQHIDSGLESARTNIISFAGSRAQAILQSVWAGLMNAQGQAAATAQQQGKTAPTPVVGVPTQLAANLWQGVGGMLAGAIAQANRAPPPAAAAAPGQALPTTPNAAQIPLPATPAAH